MGRPPKGMFAKDTSVTVAKSKAELESTLEKYGADKIMIYQEKGNFIVAFEHKSRMVQLRIYAPSIEDMSLDSIGRKMGKERVEKIVEKECRQRWRVLVGSVKMKLEMIHLEYSSVDREFMADLMLRDGSTFGQTAIPEILSHYETGKMPSLLALPTPKGNKQ